MNWNDIVADPTFQSQPPEVKMKTAENYINNYWAKDPTFTSQKPEIQDQAISNLMDTVRPPSPEGWGQEKYDAFKLEKEVLKRTISGLKNYAKNQEETAKITQGAINSGFGSLNNEEKQRLADEGSGWSSMGIPLVGKPIAGAIASKIKPEGMQGIRTTIAEDLGKTRLGKWLDVITEKIPFSGMGRFRKLQQLEADNAAKNYLSHYIIDPAAPDIAQANKDFINTTYETMKQSARVGNVNVIADSTRKEAGNLINRYPTVFESIQDKKTKGILKNILGDTKDKIIPESTSPILNAQGKTITTPAETITPTFDFDTLWELRKGLGTAADNAANKEAKTVLTQVKHAVSDDMEKLFARTNTDASRMFKEANDAYKKYDVKYNQVKEAYDAAIGNKGARDQGFFSPQDFGKRLKNLAYAESEKRGYSIWTPQEIEEATGLANVMQVVKRAGQYMENPPTGNRLADLWVLGLSYKVPYTLPVAWVTTFLNTTKQGKSLLKTAANAPTDSKAMRTVMLTIYDKYREQNPDTKIRLDAQGNEVK